MLQAAIEGEPNFFCGVNRLNTQLHPYYYIITVYVKIRENCYKFRNNNEISRMFLNVLNWNPP